MVLAEPIQGIGHQITQHFWTAIVEDKCVPVRVEALTWISVFIQGRAVEVAQAVRIGGEMPRHPVGDHAQATRVCRINKRLKFLRGAVADGWRIQTNWLIPPRTVERMLTHRHDLDVGKSHVVGVIDQFFRKFTVGHETFAVLVTYTLPRA